MLNIDKPNTLTAGVRKRLKECWRLCQRGQVAAAKKTFDLIFKWITERRIDRNIKTDCGYTPLHIAAYAGWVEEVRLLVTTYNANDIDDSNSRIMPIHLAAQKNQLAVFQLLVQHSKSNLTNTTGTGQIALHIAVANGSFQIVQEIFENHPDMLLNLDNDMNALLLRLAEKTHQTEVLIYLRKKMGIKVKQEPQIVSRDNNTQSDILIALAKRYQPFFSGESLKSIRQRVRGKQKVTSPVISSCSSTITAPPVLANSFPRVTTVDPVKKPPFRQVTIDRIISELSLICHYEAGVKRVASECDIRHLCTHIFEKYGAQRLTQCDYDKARWTIIENLIIKTNFFLAEKRKERSQHENLQSMPSNTRQHFTVPVVMLPIINVYIFEPTRNAYVCVPTVTVHTLTRVTPSIHQLTAQSLGQWMSPASTRTPLPQISNSYHTVQTYPQLRF